MLLAPFAHLFFKDVQVASDANLFRNLLLVAAIGLPFDALTVVAQAKLRIDLRFRTLALIGTGNVLGTALLSVAFACTRKLWPDSPVGGAMSLVLPRPIISAATMIFSFALSGVRLKMRPAFRRWWFVLRDSRYFFFTSFFNTLLMQGDYLIAGIFFSAEQLGAYYFAFNLSTQTVQLVGANLTSVLLPSFAKLDKEPERQRDAYIKVCSLIAAGGRSAMPDPRRNGWSIAPPRVQEQMGRCNSIVPNLNYRNGVRVTEHFGGMSLLQAQGRYRTVFLWTVVTAVWFLVAVTRGKLTGTTGALLQRTPFSIVSSAPWA